tara:strand:- start:309 stop:749 length:441 start_codon:yes stop_codon:yes gene_type:complete
MDLFNDLYQQLIIDHNKNPRNYHPLENCTHRANGHNPLCGDEISIEFVEEEGIIKQIAFQGSGCAISIASSSLMTTSLEKKKIENAITIYEAFINLAKTGKTNRELGKLSVLAGVYKYPSRVKCATLAWHTFNGAVKQTIEKIKTE